MASDTIICTSKRPLDPTLLNLEEDEATFFKLLTGIQDEEEAYNSCSRKGISGTF